MMLNAQLLSGSWRQWWSIDAPRVGPGWLQLLWTFAFSLMVAVGFTLLVFMFPGNEGAWRDGDAWIEVFGRCLVVSLVIGYLVHGLLRLAMHLLGEARAKALRGWPRTLFFSGVPLLGVALGWPLGMTLAGIDLTWLLRPQAVAGVAVGFAAISIFFHLVFRARRRQIAAQMHATEAQLKLLQAQIEPHFLFNTLANVQSLIDADPARAKAMLESFTDYLRLALPQLRRERTPLGIELDGVQAYLELLSLRMAGRLRYSIRADAAVRETQVLPLLVQPLVENAIRHGLEPKVEGGSIEVHAERRNGRVQIVVSDDGLGLDAPRRPGPPQGGVGLDNVRARLDARYGGDARLRLERLDPGTRATLDLPAT